jgi:signal transduction histidine kinase
MTGIAGPRAALRRPAPSDTVAGAGCAGIVDAPLVNRGVVILLPLQSSAHRVMVSPAKALRALTTRLKQAPGTSRSAGPIGSTAGVSVTCVCLCAIVPFPDLMLVALFGPGRPKLPPTLIDGVLLLLVMGLLILHWRAYAKIQRRVRILSESMSQFATSGFAPPLAIPWRAAPSKAPGPVQWLISPAHQIGAAERGAELMASAILESKRQMLEREARNLAWLSFLCHDLGAPLLRVLSRIEALRSARQPCIEEQQGVLESAHIEIEQMSELIASVSDFAQTDRDMERTFEPTNIRQFLEYALTVFEFDAGRRNIEFDLRIVPGVGEIRMHKILVRRALENLISNALRFTPQGGLVSLRVERCGDIVSMRVSDTGPGIPPDEINHVFDYRFRGESKANTLGQGSSGLGLALVRKVAALHDGEVSVRNLEPHGAEFTISLPLAGPLPPSHPLS